MYCFIIRTLYVIYRKRYESEQHIVRTRDDYLLCVHRIPSPMLTEPKVSANKKAGKSIRKAKTKIHVIDNIEHFSEKLPAYPPGERKPVVLLYHGFLMSSEVWVCNVDEYRNLPLLLAQRGYDVWLGNARGNKYSQNHLWKNPRHQDFWEFSINEFAMADLPDTVNVSECALFDTSHHVLTYMVSSISLK